MRNRTSILFASVATLLVSSVFAEGPTPAEPTTTPAPASSEPLAMFEGHKVLTEVELGEQRAKAKIEIDKVTINALEQDGVVTGNAAVGNRTGENSIGGDAFVGADGFINAVQNTGNNVLIQNSTIINVSVEQ